jgi:sugar phosphate isomerase/epimerase
MADRLRLGIDAYSLRAFQWKDIQLIDYAASLGVDAMQIDMGDFASREPEHIRTVREHAAARGIHLDAATGCVCPVSSSFQPKTKDPVQYLTESMLTANELGAKVLRCFISSPAERRSLVPVRSLIDSTIPVLRSVRQRAKDLDLRIAVENHGDLTAHEMRELIETVGKDFVGSCLDTGNPMWVLEDPADTVEILGPYALTSHVRDSVLYEHAHGAAFQWVAMGDGTMDWPRILDGFRRLCPQVPLQLEIITGRRPQILPFLDAQFWKIFPDMTASGLARFVALAKRGHPFEGFMVIADSMQNPPSEYTAALKEQQRTDLERSVAYARETLGLGAKGALVG